MYQAVIYIICGNLFWRWTGAYKELWLSVRVRCE